MFTINININSNNIYNPPPSTVEVGEDDEGDVVFICENENN